VTNLFKKLFSDDSVQNDVGDVMHEHITENENEHGDTRFHGKIIKVSKDGYGFISSKDIPFTRIFFHWSALRPDTKKFTDLKTGMKVSFVAFTTEDKGYRAIKIKVEDE